MSIQEIVVPESKPETEWVRGRALQKMSATRTHSRLQFAIASALDGWCAGRGEVGVEWRFRISRPGTIVRPLIPDVSYVAIERLRLLRGHELEVPRLAPDVIVEILSPDDRRDDIDDKIATYLAAGSRLVIIVEPQSRTIEVHDPTNRQDLRDGDVLQHPALPGFALDVTNVFAAGDPPTT
jgi:Uma2 family endonuclease